MGVNFFFVLSGFLITYLLINEKETYQKINIPYFYVRRILRIWPLYYAALLIGFVGFPILKELTGGVVNESASPILYVFFGGNFSDMWYGLPDATILGVLWSVSIEEQFYLFWPILLSVLPAKHYVKVFGAIILGSIVFRSFYYQDYMVLYYHTFSVISDMCMGGMIAYWSYYRPDFRAFFEKLPRWSIILVYLIGGVTIVFEKSIFTLPFLQVFSRLIFSFFFAFVLLEQNYSRHSFYKMKNWRRLTRWGQMTYGLYCLHFIGILAALMISKKMGFHESIFGVLVVETVLALGVSWGIARVSYRFFEQPFLKLKKRFAFFRT